MLFGDMLTQSARLHPRKPAIVCDEERLTYRELDEKANRLANSLRHLGVVRGDRVAFISKNSVYYPVIVFATARIGAALVPLNWRCHPRELTHIINDSRPKVLVADAEYVPTISEMRLQLESVSTYIGIRAREARFLDFDRLLEAASSRNPEVPVDENDLLYVLYTGGTTGVPKGVMLSHRNMLWSVVNRSMEMGIWHGDIAYDPHPLFHAGGAAATATFWGRGGTFVTSKEFDPGYALASMERHSTTYGEFVPSALLFMLECPEVRKHDLTRMRLITYGGSPIPPDRLRQALEVFSCDFYQCYGQTEASPYLTYLRPEDHVPEGPPQVVRRLASCGREAFGVQVRVVNERGVDIAWDSEIGEIVVRGPNVMKGYWNMPEETATALKDGWLHTGDLAKVDEQGYIYIVDRKKDMIISGGENIYPVEIENVLSAHPAVLEAAVIGVPDPRWGEAVKAVVVLRPGATATERELIDHCRDYVASYKKPKSVDFVAELPKTAVGKVFKVALRERYRVLDRREHTP